MIGNQGESEGDSKKHARHEMQKLRIDNSETVNQRRSFDTKCCIT